MIRFNQPYHLDKGIKYIEDVLNNNHVQGDGKYTILCEDFLKEFLVTDNIMMMSSCSHALECALRIIDLKPGEEIIIPSFAYPSVANAVLLANGKVVLSQVQLETMTLDPLKIEEKITDKTRGIIPIHYGGVCCEMSQIMAIAQKYSLWVIEDSAQSFATRYKESYAGTIGHIGCFSFHGTKNIVSGEGGALVVKTPELYEKAMIYRQKGTNQLEYKQGKTDHYEWVGVGSSYSPNELSMALLYSQLQEQAEITKRRKAIYSRYLEGFLRFEKEYSTRDIYHFSSTPPELTNGHIFFIVFEGIDLALRFISIMAQKEIEVRTHFVPLHESAYGIELNLDKGVFEAEAHMGQRLVRLPLYPDLTDNEVEFILCAIEDFLCKL